jgi:hypothetical protein
MDTITLASVCRCEHIRGVYTERGECAQYKLREAICHSFSQNDWIAEPALSVFEGATPCPRNDRARGL